MKRGIFGTTNIYDPVNVVNGARVQFANNYDAGGALRCRRRQTHFVVSPKPKEELYDTEADPDEVHNLANDPKYQKMLTKMRGTLNKWIKDTKDLDAISERELINRGIVRDRLTEYEERKKPGYKSGWF